MGALGYGWRNIEVALGLPSGYTEVGDFPAAEKLRILSREIEPLDQESIERIAQRCCRRNQTDLSAIRN
jgi:hypothetical protein